MLGIFRRIGRFLTEMDARAATSLGVSLTLLGFVVTMFLFGQQWLNLREDDILTGLLARTAASPLALAGVAAIYVLLALTGFPQILLFTATVIAFGPAVGSVYAWIGTMVSATFTFALGHFLGGQWVRRFGGARAQATIDFLGRHAILASGLVRVVPSAPFIVVNAAAGAAHLPIWKFWVGTGIGIVPKIALVAAIGSLAPSREALEAGVSGILAFFTSREPRDLILLGLVVAVWIGILLAARWAYLSLRRRGEAGGLEKSSATSADRSQNPYIKP